MVHPHAGRPAPAEILIDPDALLAAYAGVRPDPAEAAQRVTFGTSGHRGTSANGTFNEWHVLAITQAVCEHRARQGIAGPLFLGKDTHLLSAPAERTALEVLAGNGVTVVLAAGSGLAPTPVVSREILVHNRRTGGARADGIVLTPSHNPPADGGFKYNPPHGGPAGADVTRWIEARANALLAGGLGEVRRVGHGAARAASTTHERDFVRPYVEDLAGAVDLAAVRAAGLRIGIDPLGGSALPYVQALAEVHGLDVTVVNDRLDPRFAFMTLDHDGRIRMDCSSPYAMRPLVDLKDRFDVAFGMDPDADRHGIVAPSTGLLDPNHYLAVAIRYLLGHRPGWPRTARVGKTLVSSGILDRVVAAAGREVYETPVGFKWFAEGLAEGRLAFAGEESAGASFLRQGGGVWTTDKDGILLGLLAAEITARTGRDPGEHFEEIARAHGRPFYRRVDRPASAAQRAALATLAPRDVCAATLAGEPILRTLTTAPGNGEAIGGLKVVAGNGWFAARPSGTEAVYKVYAESFCDPAHLDRLLEEAGAIVDRALAAGV